MGYFKKKNNKHLNTAAKCFYKIITFRSVLIYPLSIDYLFYCWREPSYMFI